MFTWLLFIKLGRDGLGAGLGLGTVNVWSGRLGVERLFTEKKTAAAKYNVYSNLTFAFQNGKIKFAQQYFGSYALIQVFCFCSTNLTWFNSIIK